MDVPAWMADAVARPVGLPRLDAAHVNLVNRLQRVVSSNAPCAFFANMQAMPLAKKLRLSIMVAIWAQREAS